MTPIAVTCGEPAGVGPEIIVKARRALGTTLPFFVIGDPRHFAGFGMDIAELSAPSDASEVEAYTLPVLPHAFSGSRACGTPDPANAQAVIDVIARAVSLTQSGEASAVCTAPIHKKALIDGAGFAYPGHTEFLAHLGGKSRVVMMLASDALKVVPTTIHIAVDAVPAALTADLLAETIEITQAALIRDFGVPAPRLAVAGLNPHAGEGGAMGTEEIELIAPVLEALRAKGFDIDGPRSADTMFHDRARAGYDAAICMYHDQALIPIKTLDFDRGVNVTLGLPFIRTSPDHGTALDIAGQGIASATSMIAALEMAAKMATNRGAFHGRD